MQEYNLIIIAMKEEEEAFIKALPIQETDFSDNLKTFSYHDENFLIMRGEVGKGSTCFHLGYLEARYKIKRIFNIGTSGGLFSELNIGDIVIADKVCYFDVDACEFGYERGQVPGFPLYFEADKKYIESKLNILKESNFTFKVWNGLIASSDTFMTRDKISKFPILDIKPFCVEMEAAAVGQSAYLMKVPFVIIRSISDIITRPANADDSVKNIEICSKNCAETLLALI